jgi:hypothetical protein
MVQLLITIKPSLGRLVQNGVITPELYQAIREGRLEKIYFRVMEETEKLAERLTRYVEIIVRFFKDRTWRNEALENIGTKILDYARENVEQGYEGTDVLNAVGVQWQQRAELTQRLYYLRGYDPNAPGMFTGGGAIGGDEETEETSVGRFVDSFRIGDNLNVFIVNPDIGGVVVGTRFAFARVLEEGGAKTGGHLGVRDDWSPAKWLLDALMDKEGLSAQDAWEEAFRIRDQLVELGSLQGIPPRPFLKPALWYVYDQEEALDIICKILGYHLRYMFESMPHWSQIYDQVKVTTGDNLPV